MGCTTNSYTINVPDQADVGIEGLIACHRWVSAPQLVTGE